MYIVQEQTCGLAATHFCLLNNLRITLVRFFLGGGSPSSLSMSGISVTKFIHLWIIEQHGVVCPVMALVSVLLCSSTGQSKPAGSGCGCMYVCLTC